jgi:cytochrome c oxidase subunit 2
MKLAPMISFPQLADALQSVLGPASAEAGQINRLWWWFLAVLTGVFLLVLLWLGLAVWRAVRIERSAAAGVSLPPSKPGAEKAMIGIVSAAVGVTVLILFGLLFADFTIGRALRPPETGGALTIKITGKQWWWQIEYEDAEPSKIFQTANELHLPQGRPVQLLLQSNDVIHSFWIPGLQGKKDLIPGHQTSLWITAERSGLFRGQCAEFCGYQHAHMGLLAVVESPEDFARWQEAQRQSAPPPTAASAQRGQEVFLHRTCAMCHAIQGTPADSHVGPPLTHLATQQTIAAGSFPNTRGYLAGWILDPQALKPGTRMPPNPLSPDELRDLLDYLDTLK